MGNFICRSGTWSDKEALEAWVPLLVPLFIYNDDSTIKSVNTDFAKQNVLAGQLKSLSILLKGKAGVSNKTIKHIKKLYYYQRDHGNLDGATLSI